MTEGKKTQRRHTFHVKSDDGFHVELARDYLRGVPPETPDSVSLRYRVYVKTGNMFHLRA